MSEHGKQEEKSQTATFKRFFSTPWLLLSLCRVAVFCRCLPGKQKPWNNQATENQAYFLVTSVPCFSSLHNCLSFPVVKRQARKKGEHSHIRGDSLRSSHEYSLKILYFSLPSQALIHSPHNQTAQGLSHPFLDVTQRIQIHFSERIWFFKLLIIVRFYCANDASTT